MDWAGRAIQNEEVSQTPEFGRQEEQGHQKQVKGKKLHRNVIGHVEGEDLNAVREANQRSQRGRRWNNQ